MTSVQSVAKEWGCCEDVMLESGRSVKRVLVKT